jgi:hypothetical protein
MLGILSFFMNPQSVLAPLAAAALALTVGYGGGYIRGHDGAVANYRVAALNQQVAEMKNAADSMAKQLEDDRKLVEVAENERLALEAEIQKVIHAQASSTPACRLSAPQLLLLKRAADKTG